MRHICTTVLLSIQLSSHNENTEIQSENCYLICKIIYFEITIKIRNCKSLCPLSQNVKYKSSISKPSETKVTSSKITSKALWSNESCLEFLKVSTELIINVITIKEGRISKLVRKNQ